MNIYANYGWGSGYERRPLSYEGYYVADYGYFDLTQIKHIHSNNYIVKNHGFVDVISMITYFLQHGLI